MTKADLLAGARGRPVPFELDGFSCLLRPLTFGDRQALFDYIRERGEEPGSGVGLQAKIVTLAVCDEQGQPLLTEADLAGFAVPIAEAIATEVARRNGIDGKGAGAPGKAASPTTTS